MSKYATRQRKTLLGYLCAHADESLSAKEIASALEADGVSLSAVYRNLSELEAEGKVSRLSKDGSRNVYYRYTDAEECKKHLHLSCSKCGRTYHMDVSATDTLIKTVEEDSGFNVDSSSTVLYGVCSECIKSKGKDC